MSGMYICKIFNAEVKYAREGFFIPFLSYGVSFNWKS